MKPIKHRHHNLVPVPDLQMWGSGHHFVGPSLERIFFFQLGMAKKWKKAHYAYKKVFTSFWKVSTIVPIYHSKLELRKQWWENFNFKISGSVLVSHDSYHESPFILSEFLPNPLASFQEECWAEWGRRKSHKKKESVARADQTSCM